MANLTVADILNLVFDSTNNRLKALPELLNNEAMQARNAADSADVDVIKLNASDEVQISQTIHASASLLKLASQLQIFQTSKTQIADNTATAIATITTPTSDGGNYVCLVLAAVTNRSGEATSAIKAHLTIFAHGVTVAGTQVSSAVTEIAETNSAAMTAPDPDLGTVTMTVTNDGSNQVSIKYTADATGTGAGTAEVDIAATIILLDIAFSTRPTIAAA